MAQTSFNLLRQGGAMTTTQGHLTVEGRHMLMALANAALPAPSTFAGLPLSPQLGQVAVITDSSVTTWGAAAAGGGTSFAAVLWNGIQWGVYAI